MAVRPRQPSLSPGDVVWAARYISADDKVVVAADVVRQCGPKSLLLHSSCRSDAFFRVNRMNASVIGDLVHMTREAALLALASRLETSDDPVLSCPYRRDFVVSLVRYLSTLEA